MSAMPVDAKLLCNIPLFEGLSPDQLAAVAAKARQRTYKGDEAILHQDDPGETLYVILSGIVKISMVGTDGNEVFLAVLAAGENFGELSLIDSQFRSADVQTQEETTLVSIDRPTFNELIATVPPFSMNLLRILAHRTRRANVRIHAHCTLDVFGLVARQLLEFAELHGIKQPDGSTLIPIRLTQGDIGDLVGASRERVNQVMGHFREKKMISVDPKTYRITVIKPEELRKRLQ
jgi:CRP/FNR family cyclic AMP-dependent transcriptional regulator